MSFVPIAMLVAIAGAAVMVVPWGGRFGQHGLTTRLAITAIGAGVLVGGIAMMRDELSDLRKQIPEPAAGSASITSHHSGDEAKQCVQIEGKADVTRDQALLLGVQEPGDRWYWESDVRFVDDDWQATAYLGEVNDPSVETYQVEVIVLPKDTVDYLRELRGRTTWWASRNEPPGVVSRDRINLRRIPDRASCK